MRIPRKFYIAGGLLLIILVIAIPLIIIGVQQPGSGRPVPTAESTAPASTITPVAGGHIVNNITYENAGCGINLWHAADATVVANNLSFGNKEHGISIGTNTGDIEGDVGDHFIV